MSNNLFFLSLADIFSVYPKIFDELVTKRVKVSKIYLPSDTDWQDKMYYMLLEVQKTVNEALESGQNYDELMRHKEKPIFDSSHIQRFSPASSPSNGILDEHRKKCHQIIVKSNIKVNIIWTLEDITKAAKLLKKPPQNVEFSNEYEMRKVYSLIYDVFRYKAVLSKALSDIKFYELYPQYRADENQVWLMLYELHERSFNQRNADESLQETVRYSEAKVKDLSDCLWERRRKLAASISRMRIKYGALQLSNLLPVHLQNEKVAIAATNPVITGWINPFLVRDKESAEHLFIDNGFMVIESDQELSNATVKWDNVCPLFVSCIPMDRNAFATSELVTKNFFIIQISRLGTPTAASTIRSNLKRASKHKFPMSFDYYSRVCKRRNKVCEMKNWMRRYYQQHKIHNWKMPYPINIIELHI
ncbi:uncharacterized protein isoform X3 [Musca autumnalis]|uniref:uncharacterized protein isoform X3 n=1 Tax=Musca autumnalis TaxID=221902 RepID=UPI003CEC9F13